MERLTRKIRASVVFPNELLGVSLAPNNEYMHKLLTRLAAYEDTGLEPRDYAAMRAAMDQAEEAKQQLSDVVKILGCSSIDHLKELAQAEKDGWLAVMESNNPLTMDELREMDGDPVWVEIPEEHVSEWCIAKWDPLMGRTRLWRSGGGWFNGRNCGKSVFVYRRRPEEGTA